MPHSSGGGSHHGGSHGSSHSGRSGHGHSSHLGRSRNTIYHHNFRGARKFVYYRNNKPHYLYSSDDLTKYKDVKPDWWVMWILIPYVIFTIVTVLLAYSYTSIFPLDSSIDEPVGIIDNVDVFTDQEEQELIQTLYEFKSTTGVATQILTIDSNGIGERSLESYAYSKYLELFDTENCWLLVYKSPNENSDDWAWEGMQGNNTDEIFVPFIGRFNYWVQNDLKSGNKSVSEVFNTHIKNASNSFNDYRYFNGNLALHIMIICGIMLALYLLFWVFRDVNFKYSFAELKEVQENTREQVFNKNGFMYQQNQTNISQQQTSMPDKNHGMLRKYVNSGRCKYCNAAYEIGKYERCPKCNALLPFEDSKEVKRVY